jgi:hypothetical protein
MLLNKSRETIKKKFILRLKKIPYTFFIISRTFNPTIEETGAKVSFSALTKISWGVSTWQTF